ncbi:defensin-2-like [Diprion similis]|uniref:defensin-2-like n=1 Tax=Diprion similis TaxID=362088 RepID=UPI001EF963AC|nr:defensin-2-like [Diprion similis]
MKFLVTIALFASIACVYAAILPAVINDDDKIVKLEDVDTDAGISADPESSPIRHRRVTCDVLSFGTKWGSPSKIACPVRCLAQGKKFGSCKNGVCVCRQ